MVKELSSEDAREVLDVLFEVSKILNTGLDRETLAICVRLIELGVGPEGLAAAVRELKDIANQRQEEKKAASNEAGPSKAI